MFFRYPMISHICLIFFRRSANQLQWVSGRTPPTQLEAQLAWVMPLQTAAWRLSMAACRSTTGYQRNSHDRKNSLFLETKHWLKLYIIYIYIYIISIHIYIYIYILCRFFGSNTDVRPSSKRLIMELDDLRRGQQPIPGRLVSAVQGVQDHPRGRSGIGLRGPVEDGIVMHRSSAKNDIYEL